MNLAKDDKIFSVDNEEIGQLNRFVLDPKTKKITHIVFGRGGLFNEKDYVLPMEWVNRVSDEGIYLNELPCPIDDLDPFEEEKFVITDEHALLENEYISADPGLRMYYHYPPAAYTPYGGIRGGTARGFGPASPGITTEYEENIPDNTVALKEGAKVWSEDDKHVGDVEKIYFDPNTTTATHLLIARGLLARRHKLVPVDWIENIYEDRVNLVVREQLIDNLPDYEEKES